MRYKGISLEANEHVPEEMGVFIFSCMKFAPSSFGVEEFHDGDTMVARAEANNRYAVYLDCPHTPAEETDNG